MYVKPLSRDYQTEIVSSTACGFIRHSLSTFSFVSFVVQLPDRIVRFVTVTNKPIVYDSIV